MSQQDSTTHSRLLRLLREGGADVTEAHHAAASTSEESAKARGTPLEQGAKAMLAVSGKAEQRPRLIVLSAAASIDSRKMRRLLGRSYALAAEADVIRITGCERGAVPPFGMAFEPPVETMVDESLAALEHMSFNAVGAPLCLSVSLSLCLSRAHTISHSCLPIALQGLRTFSITMKVADYLRIQAPTVVDIAAKPASSSSAAADAAE
jgi:Ala-tRNA(Pro) deacylase